MMNCGSRTSSNFLRKLSLYVLYSFSVCPLNLDRMVYRDTCGIMFSWNSSLKRGGGGSSEVRKRNGDSSTFQSYSPELRSSVFLAASTSLGRIFLVWIRMEPMNCLYTMLDFFFFVPPSAMWSELRIQGSSAPASPCLVISN